MNDTDWTDIVNFFIGIANGLAESTRHMSYSDIILTGIFLLMLYPRIRPAREKVNMIWRKLWVIRKYYEIR